MKVIYFVESNTYKWHNSASVPTRTMWCFSATESLVPENFNYYQEPFKENLWNLWSNYLCGFIAILV